MRERKTKAGRRAGPRTEQRRPEAFSDPVVWVSCLQGGYPSLIKKALEATGTRVHEGKEPPRGKSPSTVVLCPNGEDGASGMKRVKALTPGIPVLVFLGSPEDLTLAKSVLKEGAHGLLHGGMWPEQVACVLASASQEKIAIPEEILRGLAAVEEKSGEEASWVALSARQREIVGLVSKGLSDAQVAKRFSLSERTVKRELHAAYRTLRYKRRIKEAIVSRQSNQNNHPYSPND